MTDTHTLNAFENFVNNGLSEENAKFLDGLELIVSGGGKPSPKIAQDKVVVTAYFSNRMVYLMLYHPKRDAKAHPPAVLPSAAHNSLPAVMVANKSLLQVAKECEIEMTYRGLSATKELRTDASRQKALIYKFSEPTHELKQRLTDFLTYIKTVFERQNA